MRNCILAALLALALGAVFHWLAFDARQPPRNYTTPDSRAAALELVMTAPPYSAVPVVMTTLPTCNAPMRGALVELVLPPHSQFYCGSAGWLALQVR